MYQQTGTAECLRGRGFVVRVGPKPTDLTVYGRHWTGTSNVRIGVLRFYESPAGAEQAVRRQEAADRSAGSRMAARENAGNVVARLWPWGDDEWLWCLKEA